MTSRTKQSEGMAATPAGVGRATANQSAAQSRSQVKSAVWQHPYVDIFKHFKVMPNSDWKANKKQGDVKDEFAREIGRKVIHLTGTISANNYIQIPHPNSTMTRSLGLTGRYLYLQMKAPTSSVPFSFHIDLNLCDRSHGIRVSASNLFKQVSTQNGFVLQLPLNVDVDRWTVVVFDLVSLLQQSRLLPQNYVIDGSYQIKGLTLCANSVVRGVYTSDNEYDFVTLPPDMKFKFSFDISKWPAYFDWLVLPACADGQQQTVSQAQSVASKQQSNRRALNQIEEHKARIERETVEVGSLTQKLAIIDRQIENVSNNQDQALLQGYVGEQVNDNDQRTDNNFESQGAINQRGFMLPSARSIASTTSQYPAAGGIFQSEQGRTNPKFSQDPILELKHIIGYSPAKCMNLKWSRIANENIILFTSCGTLIAMDAETNEQTKFFVGHSAPICCFDVSQSGGLVATAQEGKNSIIRVWDYQTTKCLQMFTMPVLSLSCISFSPDGKWLACSGKEGAAKRYGKEMIIIWDISKVYLGAKADIVAKQVFEFNVLSLKFSPIENHRLISCGQQNIRFWRIKEEGKNLRGSAVGLNQFARDNVFTCLDFELSGMRSGPESIVQQNGSQQKSDGLRRVYVASKTGMVYQVNYDDETLEATYRTNDSAIYSIAISQAFCVTGSEDQFMRIWALDFNEFLMEARHEGTVCSVDISADGLKVACGTLNGSVGILNKSNQRYQTLLRSHTASIICMDFHLAKQNVISVSQDGTIRLWDLFSFDQVVEFSSPIDQPLCVAAHPTLPIFACGFQSGTMRVFDIEKTCVCDSFTQFNQPIRSLAYSPNGALLITCCENGSVALHDARRQHLPTKVLNLEIQPEFVHVAFSSPIVRQVSQVPNLSENQSQSDLQSAISEGQQIFAVDSLFGIIGEGGNNVMVYSTDVVSLKHEIKVGHVIRSFQFTKNNKEMIVVTKDQRIRVYGLSQFEGSFVRELQSAHKGAITSTDLSLNGGFMLTGGQDNLLKLWDYNATRSVPYFFQAFIGHTHSLVDAMFNPIDNRMVISAGQNDGIYIWQFNGDVTSQISNSSHEQQMNEQKNLAENGELVAQSDRSSIQEPTVLELMRAQAREKRKTQLAEYSFILPTFKIIQLQQAAKSQIALDKAQDRTGISQYYENQVRDRQLSFNQFVSVKQLMNIDITVDRGQSALESQCKVIEPTIVNGYDGFGGVHDNLFWTPSTGMITYTLHNKIIIENTRTRQQKILVESEVRLSTLARSPNENMLAVAEGEASRFGNAVIYLIDLTQNQVVSKITFFRHGVQTMAFSNCGRFLIAGSVPEENCLVVLDVNSGLVCEGGTVILRDESVNKIAINPYSDGDIDFVTVGQRGNFMLWRYDTEMQRILNIRPEMSEELQSSNFTCVTYTPKLPAPFSGEMLMLGTSDGAIVAVNPTPKDNSNINKLEWVEFGKKDFVLGEEISSISYAASQVVISGAQGSVIRYADRQALLLPPDDRSFITLIKTEDSISATQMDKQNNEGVIGTAEGSIKFIQFNEDSGSVVTLVSKVSSYLDPISILRYDQNPNVFLASTGKSSGDIKLLTSGMLDPIYTYPCEGYGPVSFVASAPRDKTRLIGHLNGCIKIVSTKSLKVLSVYKVDLNEGETLSCASYSPSGQNFAVGTSFGSIYLGYLKRDPMSNQTRRSMFLSKIDAVSESQDYAVTSVMLTSFNPQGCILAAFDNGHIRCWHSSVKHEVFIKLQAIKQSGKASQRKTQAYEISEFGDTQFDIVDKFDMFENPHGVTDLTEHDAANLSELYGGKKYPDCEAVFNNSGPSSDTVDHYFCYVSALQYIFVRNINLNETVKKISLMHFPTKLCITDYNKLAAEAGLDMISRIGIASLIAVGTKEGKVLIYRLDSQEARLILKTKGGVLYGGVTALSIQESGHNFLAASSTGEVASFQLLQNMLNDDSKQQE